MSITDLFIRDATTPLDLSSLPSGNELSALAKSAQELLDTNQRIHQTALILSDLEDKRKKLESEILPALMQEAQVDRIGIGEADLILSQYAKASIPVSWSDERRAMAFEHLDALGAGDLIRAAVIVSFPREELAIARRFVEVSKKWLKETTSNAEPTLDMNIHHATLSSWLVDELNKPTDEKPTNRPPINFETIGAFVGWVAKIVARKEKSKMKRGFR